jgi:hypothetical protein
MQNITAMVPVNKVGGILQQELIVFSEGGQLFWRPSKVEDTVKQQRAG